MRNEHGRPERQKPNLVEGAWMYARMISLFVSEKPNLFTAAKMEAIKTRVRSPRELPIARRQELLTAHLKDIWSSAYVQGFPDELRSLAYDPEAIHFWVALYECYGEDALRNVSMSSPDLLKLDDEDIQEIKKASMKRVARELDHQIGTQ